jgi:penicillin-binding protein 2
VIYDRNHVVLASNQPSYDITVIPSELSRQSATRQQNYAELASIIGGSAATYAKVAEAKGLSYTQPLVVAGNIGRDQALTFDQSSVHLAAFALDVNPIRTYPDGPLLSLLIGYTGRVSPADLTRDPSYLPPDYIGKTGLELQYESVLRGVNGRQQTEVDVTGKPVKVLASKPAIPGENLVLSIDKGLQQEMTTTIQQEVTAAGVTQAAGIALNPQTGEVLAAVSLPSYDNNLFAEGISTADYSKLATNPAQPLFNKAILGAFPTGSVIKPLVASAALTEHVITTSTQVYDNGSIQVPNQYDPSITYTFHSYEGIAKGVVNLFKAMEISSNVFFFTIGGGYGNIVGLGVQRLDKYYAKFGLGTPTGIDLPEETGGYLPTPDSKQRDVGEPWYIGDTYNISVGQGDLRVSPLQLAVAISAIANGGTVYQPHLVDQILDDQGRVVKQIKPVALRQGIIPPDVLATVRLAMRDVVTNGTACCLIEKQVPVPVAAKTGTAETDPSAKTGAHAWFEAFAPYDNPSIVMVVLVENAGEGGYFAAPPVRESLAWWFNQPGHR